MKHVRRFLQVLLLNFRFCPYGLKKVTRFFHHLMLFSCTNVFFSTHNKNFACLVQNKKKKNYSPWGSTNPERIWIEGKHKSIHVKPIIPGPSGNYILDMLAWHCSVLFHFHLISFFNVH
ncbi:hypothetical protein CLIB1423_44S00254 [[Candida] railenensis]|uniref:Uncharacterized protein n=1 Tax=[Candida] railenensis TaxID=45579 RepID=A0A9P0QVZ1_9ASCO|nr:hypothetical protein CLIB1423_44S00254 [[Candida] railenensis]